MSDAPDEPSEEQKLLWRADHLVVDLANACSQLRAFDTPEGRDPAGFMLNTLMTELWDRGFSQTEIRKAFTDAVEDMNRYAAGQERR